MFFNDAIEGLIGVLLVITQAIVLIASIFPVENALKKNFDKHGNRRMPG